MRVLQRERARVYGRCSTEWLLFKRLTKKVLGVLAYLSRADHAPDTSITSPPTKMAIAKPPNTMSMLFSGSINSLRCAFIDLSLAVTGRQRCRFIVLFQQHQWRFVAVYGNIRVPAFWHAYSPLTSPDIKAFGWSYQVQQHLLFMSPRLQAVNLDAASAVSYVQGACLVIQCQGGLRRFAWL